MKRLRLSPPAPTAPCTFGRIMVRHPRTHRAAVTTLPARQASRVAADLRRKGFQVTLVLYS